MKYIHKIVPSENAEDPRSFVAGDLHNTFMHFKPHKRYTLPEEVKGFEFTGHNIDEAFMHQPRKPDLVYLIDWYEHSGISITMREVEELPKVLCKFDTATSVGIFLGFKDQDQDLEQLRVQMRREFEDYSAYLAGDVDEIQVFKVTTCDHGHEHEEYLGSSGDIYGSITQKDIDYWIKEISESQSMQ